jgi:RimJ/RimL family protein N-acetyltransferase
VVLREFAEPDVEPYAQAFAEDPELGAIIGHEEDPDETAVRRRIEEEQHLREEGVYVSWAMADPADDGLLGSIALHSFNWAHRRADTGFMVLARARRRGVGAEALRMVVRWGFGELGLNRVGLATIVDNEPTIRLAERAGFRREGVLRAFTYERGKPLDNLFFGAVKGDPEWA